MNWGSINLDLNQHSPLINWTQLLHFVSGPIALLKPEHAYFPAQSLLHVLKAASALPDWRQGKRELKASVVDFSNNCHLFHVSQLYQTSWLASFQITVAIIVLHEVPSEPWTPFRVVVVFGQKLKLHVNMELFSGTDKSPAILGLDCQSRLSDSPFSTHPQPTLKSCASVDLEEVWLGLMNRICERY